MHWAVALIAAGKLPLGAQGRGSGGKSSLPLALGGAAPPYPWESRQQRPQSPGAFPNLVQILSAFKLSEESVVSPAETEAVGPPPIVVVVLASATGIIRPRRCLVNQLCSPHLFCREVRGEISLLPHKQRKARSCVSCRYMIGVCCAIWTAWRVGCLRKRQEVQLRQLLLMGDQERIFSTP